MNAYGSGEYFFTFIAPKDAEDPWMERIGCPPEIVE
jgi:hypothetical protein